MTKYWKKCWDQRKWRKTIFTGITYWTSYPFYGHPSLTCRCRVWKVTPTHPCSQENVNFICFKRFKKTLYLTKSSTSTSQYQYWRWNNMKFLKWDHVIMWSFCGRCHFVLIVNELWEFSISDQMEKFKKKNDCTANKLWFWNYK